MGIVIHQEKEIRRPGRAIPPEKQRDGALGKLDAMSLTVFKKTPLAERVQLLDGARLEQLCEKFKNRGEPSEIKRKIGWFFKNWREEPARMREAYLSRIETIVANLAIDYHDLLRESKPNMEIIEEYVRRLDDRYGPDIENALVLEALRRHPSVRMEVESMNFRLMAYTVGVRSEGHGNRDYYSDTTGLEDVLRELDEKLIRGQPQAACMKALLSGEDMGEITTGISNDSFTKLNEEKEHSFPVLVRKSEDQTVVFVVPNFECKYVVAYEKNEDTGTGKGREFIIALPHRNWINYHHDVLKYIAEALGYDFNEYNERLICVGGGSIRFRYVDDHGEPGGVFMVKGRSMEYGVGPHEKVERILNEMADANLPRLIEFFRNHDDGMDDYHLPKMIETLTHRLNSLGAKA